MSLGVQSYPELYTTLLGWQLYDELWDLLSQTGLAYLPFIGMIWRHVSEPYTSQEAKDAGSTSLRRMEVSLFTVLAFIFFAVSPAMILDPTVLTYAPACQTSGESSSYHPGNTGTTYDQAFTVPTGDIRIPILWMAVLSVSEGITAAANTMIACVPDLRQMVSQVNMAAISDPAVKQAVQSFEQQCFIPARTQYLTDVHNNAPVLATIQASVEQYGASDTEWPGSYGFLQTYYTTLTAAEPIQDFPYVVSEDINADAHTESGEYPLYGTPTCAAWWTDSQHGLKQQLLAVLSPSFWDTFSSTIFSQPQGEDDVLKRIVFNSHTGYQQANQTVNNISLSHVAVGLGTWFHQLDAYPKLYAASQSAPIIQALLLLMVYAFLPFAWVFTGYKPVAFVSGAIIVFSLIFWTFIWRLVTWADSALMTALYGDSWFSHQSPSATLVDMITGLLIIVAPLFWFSFMGSMGVGIAHLIGRSASVLGDIGAASASNGASMLRSVGSRAIKK